MVEKREIKTRFIWATRVASVQSLQCRPTSDFDFSDFTQFHLIMSDSSEKSHLLRRFKDLFSRRSRSPSQQRAQSVTPHNASASAISASPTNSVLHLCLRTHKFPNIRQSSGFQPRFPEIKRKSGEVLLMKGWKPQSRGFTTAQAYSHRCRRLLEYSWQSVKLSMCVDLCSLRINTLLTFHSS